MRLRVARKVYRRLMWTTGSWKRASRRLCRWWALGYHDVYKDPFSAAFQWDWLRRAPRSAPPGGRGVRSELSSRSGGSSAADPDPEPARVGPGD